MAKSRDRFTLVLTTAALLFGCALAPTTLNAGTSPPAAPQRQSSADASILIGKVIRVIDGDTIEVVDSGKSTHRIRLKGIDAPERSQLFAIEATRSLAAMVSGREVTVEWTKLDDGNRIVGRVLVNEKDVCLEQIRAGMAWHFKRYQDEQSAQQRELYDRVQNEARSARRGLWTDSAPIEPWVIRERQRRTLLEIYADQSSGITRSADSQQKLIRGNRRSMIYHWPGCPNYDDIAMHNRVLFSSRVEAEKAGYRAARNCR